MQGSLGKGCESACCTPVDLAEDLLKYERLELLLSTDDSVAVMHQFQHDCEIELEHDPNMRASVMIDILRNAIEAVMEARETTHAGYMALPLWRTSWNAMHFQWLMFLTMNMSGECWTRVATQRFVDMTGWKHAKPS